jgi:hypothetical protein
MHCVPSLHTAPDELKNRTSSTVIMVSMCSWYFASSPNILASLEHSRIVDLTRQTWPYINLVSLRPERLTWAFWDMVDLRSEAINPTLILMIFAHPDLLVVYDGRVVGTNSMRRNAGWVCRTRTRLWTKHAIDPMLVSTALVHSVCYSISQKISSHISPLI